MCATEERSNDRILRQERYGIKQKAAEVFMRSGLVTSKGNNSHTAEYESII
jgi:hypothetical protein